MPKHTLPDPNEDKRLEDEVARRLREAGARPAYIRRLVSELKDHRLEAVEHPSPLAPVIGDADVLVEAALQDPRNLQIARRRPVLVFGLAALLSIPIAFAVVAVVLIGGVETLGNVFGTDVGQPEYATFHRLATLYIDSARALLPPGIAIAYCAIAGRARVARGWLLLAAVALVFSAMATTLPFEISEGGREASLSLDVEASGSFARWRSAVPLLIAFLTVFSLGPLKRFFATRSNAMHRSEPRRPAL